MFGMPESTLKSMYLIKTHYIVKVIEFHPEDQTVDVIQDVCEFCNTDSGSITIQNELGYNVTVAPKKPSVLVGIPVKQLRWGQFEIQACPQPGDTGYLEIFTNDITGWIQGGGLNVPISDRHFAMDSCIFVPFVPNAKNAVDDYVTDGTSLVIKSTNAKVKITDKQEEGEDPVVDIETTSKTVHINAENGVSVAGNVDVTGDLTVSGTITADGDIKSTNGDVIAGTVSLKNHVHPFTYAAGPATGTEGVTTAPTP